MNSTKEQLCSAHKDITALSNNLTSAKDEVTEITAGLGQRNRRVQNSTSLRKANNSRPVQTWVSYPCLTYAQPAPFLMSADMDGGDWAMTKFSSVGEHARCLQVPRYLPTYLPT